MVQKYDIDYYNNIDEVLYQCAGQKQYRFVKYLLNKGVNPIGHWVPYAAIKLATLRNDIKMIKILYDAMPKEEFNSVVSKYWMNYNSEVKPKTKQFVEKLRKDSQKINEKFSQDSDPVQDLNIGQTAKLKNALEKMVKHPVIIIRGEKIRISNDGTKIFFRCATYTNSQIPYLIKNLNEMLEELDIAQFLIFPPKVKKNIYFTTDSLVYMYDVKPGYTNLFKQLTNKKIFNLELYRYKT